MLFWYLQVEIFGKDKLHTGNVKMALESDINTALMSEKWEIDWKFKTIKHFLYCWSKMSVSSVFRVFQSHPLFMSWERCKRWLTCSSKPQESHKMDFLYSFFVPFLDYISPIVTSLRQELSLFLLLYVVSWPLRQVRVKNSHFAEH